MYARITSYANYTPANSVSNDELSKILDTNHQWIVSRTGIEKRRIADKTETAFSMAMNALENLSKKTTLSNIDCIIVPTSTKEYPFPSTASMVQNALNIKNCMTLDISAACSGYVYGVNIAESLVKTGKCKRVLVVATEKYSDILNWKDRGTAILFGDAASVLIIETGENGGEIISTNLGCEEHADLLLVESGGSLCPLSDEHIENGKDKVVMIGTEIFKRAVYFFKQSILTTLEKANIKIEDVALVIPHQANIRIMQSLAKELEIPIEKVFINIAEYGNTSAASIGLALTEALEEKKIKKGDYVILTAFGAGLTWASALLRF